MITAGTIIDYIKEMICLQYPACQVYVHNVPAGAIRPYFLIFLDSDRTENNNRFLTDETASVCIKYHPLLEGEAPSELLPYNVYDLIRGIFRKGFIKIADRALKVSLIRGGKKDNEVYMIAKMQYIEERPQDETAYELIGEVQLK